MKQVTYILSILLAAFILVACEKNDMELDPGDAAVYREVPVRFKTNLPLDGIQTRYMLYGSKYPKVTTIQMLCFDSFGLYVGHREATLTSQSATDQPDYGTFEGHVPEVTARIHFIGNLTLNFESAFIGRDENVMMHALETTTYYEGAPMVYWGYHREETPVVMKEWLNSTSPNTVYMLTDRAMVELETDNQGHVVVDDNTIESIESWVISNGNSRGYIAPFNQSDLEDPFSSYYNAATGKPENVFTDYTAAGRYTAQESKLEPATSPLFLYEDANQQSDSVKEAVNRQVQGVDDARTKYQDISDNLEIIEKEVKSLGEVSRSMTDSCEKVGTAMERLSEAAQTNAAATEETNASIQEVLALVNVISNGSS